MPAVQVSIVIACRNERSFISETLRALLNGSVREIEVIVVDGLSTDGTREELSYLQQRDSRLVVLDNEARITPVAFNLGIRAAQGEYIAICGAHSLPSRDWVEQNLQSLEAHPDAAAVGGVLETVAVTPMGRVIAAVMSSRFGVGNNRFRTGGKPGWADTVVFGCYRRTVFENGLFDEELATNQDDEFNTRLLAQGKRLWFDPAIRCRYYCRSSWSAMLRQYWRYGRYKVSVFRKAGRIGAWRQLVPPAWAAFLVAALASRRGLPLISIYGAIAVLAGTRHIRGLRWNAILFGPVAASLHLAYGFGFLVGLARAF